MPWRPSPWRIPLYERVCQFWTESGFPIVTSDSTQTPFNHGEAYTQAVAKADTEMVIICDPDTLPELWAVHEAIDTVGGEVVWLFNDYRVISPTLVDAPLERLFTAPAAPGEEWRSHSIATAMCLVVRQETYWRLGGQDYRAYRCNDPAFMCAAATLTGARRIRAKAVAFDHPLEDGTSRTYDGSEPIRVKEMYYAADGNPDAMEKLVADPARGVVARGVDEWKAKWPSPPPGRVLV